MDTCSLPKWTVAFPVAGPGGSESFPVAVLTKIRSPRTKTTVVMMIGLSLALTIGA